MEKQTITSADVGTLDSVLGVPDEQPIERPGVEEDWGGIDPHEPITLDIPDQGKVELLFRSVDIGADGRRWYYGSADKKCAAVRGNGLRRVAYASLEGEGATWEEAVSNLK